MKHICLYFQVHHPFSYRTFRFLDIGKAKSYYDDFRIEKEINEAVTRYYIPLNDFLLRLIQQSKDKLKLSFYISGTALDQFLTYAPKMLMSFRELADTGQVEFLGGTASHSIVSLTECQDEFKRQISQYKERIKHFFGKSPRVFVNTDLLYNNQVGRIAFESGYQAIITNGANKILQWRSPNYIYSGENQDKINILFRNELISNAFSAMLANASNVGNMEYMKQLFTGLLANGNAEPLVNVYLNYMSLGGNEMSAKLHFFRSFVSNFIKNQLLSFSLPSDIIEQFGPVAEIETEVPICWANHFHSSYFPGNALQTDAINQLFKLNKQVDCTENTNLYIDWQYLQTSDNFHQMDENHPAYHDCGLNSEVYKSKYDAYINYMNILEDFRQRLKAEKARKKFKPIVIHKPIHKPLVARAHHQYQDYYE